MLYLDEEATDSERELEDEAILMRSIHETLLLGRPRTKAK